MKLLSQDKELIDMDEIKSMDVGIGNRIRLFVNNNCDGGYETAGIYDSYDVASEICNDIEAHMPGMDGSAYIMPENDEMWIAAKTHKIYYSLKDRVHEICTEMMDLRLKANTMATQLNKLGNDLVDIMNEMKED